MLNKEQKRVKNKVIELAQISKDRSITNETVTKTVLIRPLVEALGYDYEKPSDVIEEQNTDDERINKRIDITINYNASHAILIEAKKKLRDLDEKGIYEQVFHYFSYFPEAKILILTNGIEYRFFTDIENKNVMDKEPFFVFNIRDFEDKDIKILSWFSKGQYRPGETHRKILDTFRPVEEIPYNKSFYLKELVNKIKGKFDQNDDKSFPAINSDEMLACSYIADIVDEYIDINRLGYKITSEYVVINVDGNHKKWICRLHLRTEDKCISIKDGKKVAVIPIEFVNEINEYKHLLLKQAKRCN